MIYFFALLLFFWQTSAQQDTFCGWRFVEKIVECGKSTQVGRGVELEILSLENDFGGKSACINRNISTLVRLSPEPEDSLREASVLWGDGETEQIELRELAACPVFPGNSSFSQCVQLRHSFNQTGEQLVNIFATSQRDVRTHAQVVLSVGRCERSINLDLIGLLNNGSMPGTRMVCAGEPTIAIVRATTADGNVVVNTDGFADQALLWTGNVSLAGPIDLIPFDADGAIHEIPFTFPTEGEYPVAMFGGTNEGWEQLEAFVSVRSCAP